MNDFTLQKLGKSKEMPAKVVIYGVPKVGKSRLAAQWPDPVFINIEDGLQYLPSEVLATPKLDKFDDILAWLMDFYKREAAVGKTIVIDSLDWADNLAQKKISEQFPDPKGNLIPVSNQEYKPYSYGKGYEMASTEAARLFSAADLLYQKHGMKTVMIAHQHIKTVDLPTKDPYQQHQLKLSKALGAKATEWADLVLFCDWSFAVTKDGKTSDQQAVIRAGGDAAYVGGGRMMLKNDIPINDNTYKLLEKEITQ